ncbi:hypothetical protein PHMEG_0002422 [Phytophthora megakarya]|uniref:Avirulence (Avh) protein n=1 Tax=Phytophthora megakarya TaxID=4795 RepID=A0A225WZ17_9STRA|nr:hypothetical protein PHMEG_0002422 [Phytophthora megakarya]
MTELMNPEAEERAVPSFKQYFGLLKLPKNFAGLKKLASIRDKLGDKAGPIFNAYQKYLRKANINAQL